MKKIITVPFLFCLLQAFTSCGDETAQTRFQAAAYADSIVIEQQLIHQQLREFHNYLYDQDSLNTIQSHNNLVRQTENSIQTVEAMGSFQENDELQKATLELFRFYHSVFTDEYQQIMQLILYEAAHITHQQQEEINALIEEISHREEQYDRQFRHAYSNFAAEYDLEIREMG